MSKFTQIQKRDGRIVDFNEKKIENAIHKALLATKQGDGKIAKKLPPQYLELVQL